MTVKQLIENLQLLENQGREIVIPFVVGNHASFFKITGSSETPNGPTCVDWEDN